MTCHKVPEHMPLTFIVVLILLVILCWLDTENLQIPVHHPQIILLLKKSDDGSSSEGDSEYSEVEENVWNSTYAQNCLAMLKRDKCCMQILV